MYKIKLILCILLLAPICAVAKFDLPATDWLSLLPKEDLEAINNMPEFRHNSSEAFTQFNKPGALKKNTTLPEVMYSKKTVPEFNNKRIRIGGFPLPLTLNDKGQAVELLLVPYAGACIHVPPPPPNQIILVKYENAIRITDINRPIWVVGKINTEITNSELADTAYSMHAEKILWVLPEDL